MTFVSTTSIHCFLPNNRNASSSLFDTRRQFCRRRSLFLPAPVTSSRIAPPHSSNNYPSPTTRSRPFVTMTGQMESSSMPLPLTIGIVGFGNFGQFLGKVFAAQGHRVIGSSRGDYYAAAKAIQCEYVRGHDALMDCNPDVVIFCTSIMSLDSVLSKFPLQRLSGVLVVDVLSVKMYPHDLLLKCLPESADILCTHPMFGPESGGHTWAGLPFVYDIVRVDPIRVSICHRFIDVWRREQCRMVEMSCAAHDSHAASTQFITHTTGRMLSELNVDSTPINTRGFESLLGVVDTTCKDSFELFYGLYRYNPNAPSQLEKLEKALKKIRQQLEMAEQEHTGEKKKKIEAAIPFPCIASDEVLKSFLLRTAPTVQLP